jgi:hypothetical protein
VIATPGHAQADAADQRRVWCRKAVVVAGLPAEGFEPLDFADSQAIGRLPSWVEATESERHALALLAGAVLCARRLRRTLDGTVLRRLAQAIGDRRLAIVSALAQRAAPPAGWDWGDDPVSALTALGGEVLIRAMDAPLVLQERLALLFPPSNRLGSIDSVRLKWLADTARMLWSSENATAEATR